MTLVSLEDSVVDHEILQRPWGFYKTTVLNEYFHSKGAKHRPNTDAYENLIVTEVQIGDYLGENDIVRYGDICGKK